MGTVVQIAIEELATLVFGSRAFLDAVDRVKAWEEKEVESASKKSGVIGDLEVIGFRFIEWETNMLSELANAWLKHGDVTPK